MKHKVILDYPHLGKDKKLTTIKKNTILVDYKVDDVVIDPEVIENNPEYFQEVNWKQELRLFFKENKEKIPSATSLKVIERFIEEYFINDVIALSVKDFEEMKKQTSAKGMLDILKKYEGS